jgi:hypothetical protein
MRLIDMPSARFIRFSPCGPNGRQKKTRRRAASKWPDLDQASYYKYCNFGNRLMAAFRRACSKAWGLAKTASVINYSSNRPARVSWLTGLLSLLTNLSSSASLSPSDYNDGATLIPAGMVRIHFFL